MVQLLWINKQKISLSKLAGSQLVTQKKIKLVYIVHHKYNEGTLTGGSCRPLTVLGLRALHIKSLH